MPPSQAGHRNDDREREAGSEPGADQRDGGMRDRDDLRRRIEPERRAGDGRQPASRPVPAADAPWRPARRSTPRDEQNIAGRRLADRQRDGSQADDQRRREDRRGTAPISRVLLADEQARAPAGSTRARAPGADAAARRRIRRCRPVGAPVRGIRAHRNRTTTAERRKTRSSHAAQEGDAGERDRAARRAHREASGRPARQQTEADAGEVQQAGRDHEADRIGDRIGAGRKFGAVGMAVEDREARRPAPPRPTAAAAPPAPPSGRARPPRPRCRSRRRAAARRECRARRRTPSPAGTRSAGARSPAAPRNAPHSPTATIADDVVRPEKRMREAAGEAARQPSPLWAKAGASGKDRSQDEECLPHQSGAEHRLSLIMTAPSSKTWRAGDKPG